MKKISLILCFCFLANVNVLAQQASFADTAAVYFDELKEVTKQHESLWHKDLYAPVLLVNPATREVFANRADTAGVLSATGKVFSGVLPKSVNISNTSIQWNGHYWAMLMLPLSKNKSSRVNLFTHELFHRAQKELGFYPFNPENNHLDKKEGRIYLRLELEALKKAILSSNKIEVKAHVQNALLFRKKRRLLYAGADSTENLLELNEGICEYTGLMMSGRTRNEVQLYITKRIDYFIGTSSYVRSFAYETVPVYGYLLYGINKDWHRQVTNKTNLTELLASSFLIELPENVDGIVNSININYSADEIIAQETKRAEESAKQLSLYTKMFVEDVHVEIPLIKMNMSFDYTRMVPLADKGTVYPQIRITDSWGILEVEKGAMISSDWKKVIITKPVTINNKLVLGDGWKLELKEPFVLVNEIGSKNFIVQKKG